jgi:hypothetical protein
VPTIGRKKFILDEKLDIPQRQWYTDTVVAPVRAAVPVFPDRRFLYGKEY